MKVNIIGTGNVALVLGKLFKQANHTIVQVQGRNANALRAMSQTLQAEAKQDNEPIHEETDVCLIAVADNAIEEIAQKINKTKTLVVHTSGATSKQVLN